MNNQIFSPKVEEIIANMKIGQGLSLPTENNSGLLVIIKEKSNLLQEIRTARCGIGFHYVQSKNIIEFTIRPTIQSRDFEECYALPLSLDNQNMVATLKYMAASSCDILVHYVSDDLSTRFTLDFCNYEYKRDLLYKALQEAGLL